MPLACVNLSPWPLILLARQHLGVPMAALSESRKVLYAEVISAPTAIAAWAELLETLYARYSDRVEGRVPGTVFLKISAPAARELAAALHASVGLGESLEVAQLAALRAWPGGVREAGERRSWH